MAMMAGWVWAGIDKAGQALDRDWEREQSLFGVPGFARLGAGLGCAVLGCPRASVGSATHCSGALGGLSRAIATRHKCSNRTGPEVNNQGCQPPQVQQPREGILM
ncbi:hypothetical protein N9L68_05290 [bacterium]|nr:hypothetical protein [bacterium]